MTQSAEESVKISENGITQLLHDNVSQCQIFNGCALDDEIKFDNTFPADTNGCALEEEVKFGDGNISADEDELNTTNSSLAYLTQVRKKRKKSIDIVPRRTCTTRAIALTGIGFLVVCLVMVGGSLLMSKDIDTLGKCFL